MNKLKEFCRIYWADPRRAARPVPAPGERWGSLPSDEAFSGPCQIAQVVWNVGGQIFYKTVQGMFKTSIETYQMDAWMFCYIYKIPVGPQSFGLWVDKSGRTEQYKKWRSL